MDHFLQIKSYQSLIGNFISNTQKAGKQAFTKGYLQGRVMLLNKYWDKTEGFHSEITNNPDEEGVQEYIASDIYLEIEANYTIALGWLLDSIGKLEASPGPTQPPPPPTAAQGEINQPMRADQAQIKLPPIFIPKFSGDFSVWNSFCDLFESLVVNNAALSNVNKLHHLKSSLTGEAELVLRHFAIEGNNFEPAWALLRRRFANKRMLINAQFAKLLGQDKINSGSAESIHRILDTSTESVTSLKAQLAENERFDSILIYVLIQKLDVKTIEAWEQSRNEIEDIPTFENFTTFLENRSRMYDMVQYSTKSSESKSAVKYKTEMQRTIKTFQTSTSSNLCMCCGKTNHKIYKCYKFRALPVAERQAIVKSKHLCERCLTSQHRTDECPQSWLCNRCNGPHNNLLHPSAAPVATLAQASTFNCQASTSKAQPNNSSNSTSINHTLPASKINIGINHHTSNFSSTKTLLATAQVLIASSYGRIFKFRALIDPGSEASLISRAAANLLQLPFQQINAHIKAMAGASVGISNQLISCVIKSIHNPNMSIAIEAIVMPHLTKSRPPTCLQESSWEHLKDLQLADPMFCKSDKIDIVLGADTFYDLFLPDIRKGPRGSPSAQQTILGFILIGQVSEAASKESSLAPRQVVSYYNQLSICDQLQKFWTLEEVADQKSLTTDEELCESIFVSTHRRKPDGRYCVDLPFKNIDDGKPKFGNSRSRAQSRLLQIERRLQNNLDLQMQYSDFLREYLQLGHMQPAKETTGSSFYLPHHAILRPSSSTTKLRVVFDASAKDSSGKSLNDTLLIGPTIQEDLLCILLRWRKHRFAITADAEKMYRQIEVNPQHHQYQRILWRDNSNNVAEYDLTTVTYGTSCAPYLAIRTVQQLANDDKNIYPSAAERTLKDMYVDDFISGGDTLNETQMLQREMVDLFQGGGFKLRKWASNSSQLLDNIPATNREMITCLDICREDVIKTLGIMWHTTVDEFHFVVNLSDNPTTFSKRTFLSDVSKLFDPLGFLAPVIISAKILFQSLWLQGLGWDDPLPEEIVKEWLQIRNNFREITNITIPRWIGTIKTDENIEFHGFCDASIKAYAAVIFCRTQKNGNFSVQLLTSKTRVAPIKQVSLPKLELCGATLLAKLMQKVQTAMDIKAEIYAWTDSTIVLDWIRSSSHKITFVANRITTILEHIKPNQWRHIKSKDNPADVASRGICPSQLQQHALWWHGPNWLQRSSDEWPNIVAKSGQVEDQSRDIIVAVTTIDFTLGSIIEKFSNLDTLIRVITQCMLFARKCRTKHKSTCIITALDYTKSREILIKYVQHCTYSEEISLLNNTSESPPKLASLAPFVCPQGFLRVGGRLHNANLQFNQKHQILLPRDHHLTKLIITRIHSYTLHGGLKLTLATLRQNYWVINARTAIRSIIHKCITCHRYAAHCKEQIMSTLPAARVQQSKPFSHTGVDYAGPFNLRLSKHRGRGTYKGFVAVFVCLATKAVHLEVASDLSSKTFIAALKRFVSRRGPCSDLYSDNGTNFVGANRALKSSFEKTMSELSIEAAQFLAIKGTNWHFIPANSPHFGGLWEAAVKSFKHHLKRIVDHTILTYEEFATLLTEIEASLNSRPLCQLSSDIGDYNALTPGHFLTGGPINAIPEPSVLTINDNRLTRWQFLVKLHQDFWRSWSTDYLNELQQRPKHWTTRRENLQEGDIVIVKDDKLPPSNWLLARVIRTHPGDDGIVRVVTLKHQAGEMKRAATRVCRLPIERQ